MSNTTNQRQQIIELLQDMKAENIVVINTGEESPITDWVIVCEGTSFVHVGAIATKIRTHFKQVEGMLPYHMEGDDANRWVAIDYTDIVVHIMLPQLREYYKIEELWAEYPQETIASVQFTN